MFWLSGSGATYDKHLLSQTIWLRHTSSSWGAVCKPHAREASNHIPQTGARFASQTSIQGQTTSAVWLIIAMRGWSSTAPGAKIQLRASLYEKEVANTCADLLHPHTDHERSCSSLRDIKLPQ